MSAAHTSTASPARSIANAIPAAGWRGSCGSSSQTSKRHGSGSAMPALHTSATRSQTSASAAAGYAASGLPPSRRAALSPPIRRPAPPASIAPTTAGYAATLVGVGAFISVGKSLDRTIDRVRRAEAQGYEAAYVTHLAARDSITVLAAYAIATERIRIGTGVMPIYSRTPVATAQAIATVDELSGGRAVLGLGASHKPVVEGWFGQSLEKPVSDMREYVGIVRAILRGEDPPRGERFRSSFHFMGYAPRPGLPIYIGALSPRMLRLAGEIGDGVTLWLCNPDYVREVVIPEVTKGRERAGKELDGFDVVAAVPTAVTDEPEAARARLRG
ncbi:MAG: hypothetical protein QOI98_923, partial [Solirubrobacteraceae bacterium]|nr:hypothetical protein [Solirubrobacteraceae bacterium]